jgi:Ca2+-binding EF-hand superfamily protein
VFEEMDLDHDGVITGQQLHEGLSKMGANISGKDVAEFLKVSKVRGDTCVCVSTWEVQPGGAKGCV